MVDNKRLTIKNIDKIFGRPLYSKWVPGTYGWVVASVEAAGDTYFFELASNGRFKSAEIQLKREPVKYDPDFKQFLYKLWAWNLEQNRPEEMYFLIESFKTIEETLMKLGLMLEKITPKNTI